jgi:hypothetical protein
MLRATTIRSLLIIAGLFLATGCGPTKQGADKPDGGKADDDDSKAIQTVYDTWAKARKAGDVKGTIDCLAPEALSEAAAADAIDVIWLKQSLGRGVAEQKKACYPVMEKHGLTEKVTGKFVLGFNRYGKPEERATLGKVIKDPKAFMLELAEARKKALKDIKPRKPSTGGPNWRLTVSLVDVKIDGDKATGVILTKSEPYHRETLVVREQREKISFVKKADGWRIIPAYEEPKYTFVPVPEKDAKDK